MKWMVFRFHQPVFDVFLCVSVSMCPQSAANALTSTLCQDVDAVPAATYGAQQVDRQVPG